MSKKDLTPCYYENLEDDTGGYFRGEHRFNFNGVCQNCGQYCREKDQSLTQKNEDTKSKSL